MDGNERRKNALEALGVDAAERPMKSGHGASGKGRRRPRPLASFKAKHRITTRKQEWSMCEKKTRYRDQGTAKRAAGTAFAKRGVKLHGYLCPICGGYHLTKENRAGLRRGGRVF